MFCKKVIRLVNLSGFIVKPVWRFFLTSYNYVNYIMKMKLFIHHFFLNFPVCNRFNKVTFSFFYRCYTPFVVKKNSECLEEEAKNCQMLTHVV